VSFMCSMLHLSRSGYYQWRQAAGSDRPQRQAKLCQQIHQVYLEHQGRYGSPRITWELRQRGIPCCRNTIAKRMKEQQLRGICPKSYVPRTTNSNNAYPLADNLLQQDFAVAQPNRVWVADITYVPTVEGWLYLAAVKDLCTRKIVGWSMAESMHSELVCEALLQALRQENPGKGLIHHSDRGSQYACRDFRELLSRHGITSSMSRRGNCYDNATMESFWGTYKQEEVYLKNYKHLSQQQVKRETFKYIELYYNPRRKHSGIGYQSPQQYHLSLNHGQAA
jgi:putative transposase